jgi:hypothetical protein
MAEITIQTFARYELVIIAGLVMALLVLGKLLGFYNISSDWFWFIGALGLSVEGLIALIKQRRFDKKYKIIEKNNS